MSWLSDLLGFGSGNAGVRQALRDGGIVIDLRTAYEFDQGHIPGALNIPIDRIRVSIGRISDLRRPVILCCSAGVHCREATGILRTAGVTQVYNGGDWQSLWRTIKNA
jgi:phage shock protein E